MQQRHPWRGVSSVGATGQHERINAHRRATASQARRALPIVSGGGDISRCTSQRLQGLSYATCQARFDLLHDPPSLFSLQSLTQVGVRCSAGVPAPCLCPCLRSQEVRSRGVSSPRFQSAAEPVLGAGWQCRFGSGYDECEVAPRRSGAVGRCLVESAPHIHAALPSKTGVYTKFCFCIWGTVLCLE